MAKVNVNKRTSLACDAKLSQELAFLSKRTKKSKIDIIKQIIELMVAQAVSYETFTYDVYPDRNTVQIVFYGHHGLALVSGSSGSGGFSDENELMEFMAETASKKAAKTAAKQ
ncbi:hypothetical protein GX831_00695 [bacterium]|nr:hypothetical protein [bacterium]